MLPPVTLIQACSAVIPFLPYNLGLFLPSFLPFLIQAAVPTIVTTSCELGGITWVLRGLSTQVAVLACTQGKLGQKNKMKWNPRSAPCCSGAVQPETRRNRVRRNGSDTRQLREDVVFMRGPRAGFTKGQVKIWRHSSSPAKQELDCCWPGHKEIFLSTSPNKRTHSRNSWEMTSEVLG